MLVVYETDIGNFGSPDDLLRYMREEGIERAHVTVKLCGETVGKEGFEMSLEDVEGWLRMGGNNA